MSNAKPPEILQALHDESIPAKQRVMLLKHVCINNSEQNTNVLVELLKRSGASSNGTSRITNKEKLLDKTIEEMFAGPLRRATFVRMARGLPSTRRALVYLEDGSSAYVHVPEKKLAESLRVGDNVLLEAQGKALLHRDSYPPDAGEEAKLERCLSDGRAEVTLREHEQQVFTMSADLVDKLDNDGLDAGATLLVCSRRKMAFDVLPAENGASHCRFLDKGPVPNVDVRRDIGCPPSFIEELVKVANDEMREPQRRRRYGLPRCHTRFLCGVSGSGKTLSVNAFYRRLYEVMSTNTHVPVDELPRRVLRLRSPNVLSKWLGDSEANIERFFDELGRLASETFVGPDGSEHELPVLVIIEEADALARQRGGEAVYDRIFPTLLERLDPARPELRDRPIFILATTNVMDRIDHAFVRRIGGKIERFGRLSRRAFITVLEKHLAHRPIAGPPNVDPEALRRRLIADVTGWLFAPPASDEAQITIAFTGSSRDTIKYRRDFLTGSIAERAVHEAAEAACRVENENPGTPGLTQDDVVEGFHQQIRGLIEQLTETNVHHYVDLPDGVRVASVRRLAQPTVRNHHLFVETQTQEVER